MCAGPCRKRNHRKKADFDTTQFARHVANNQLQIARAADALFLKRKIFKGKARAESFVFEKSAGGLDLPKASAFRFPMSVTKGRSVMDAGNAMAVATRERLERFDICSAPLG